MLLSSKVVLYILIMYSVAYNLSCIFFLCIYTYSWSCFVLVLKWYIHIVYTIGLNCIYTMLLRNIFHLYHCQIHSRFYSANACLHRRCLRKHFPFDHLSHSSRLQYYKNVASIMSYPRYDSLSIPCFFVSCVSWNDSLILFVVY